jgi:hypothetical protein
MDLIREFERAALRLELMEAPIARTNAEIFQMDIVRDRGERFRLWRGHEDNVVRVTDADRARHQIVLLVQEPARAFETQHFKRYHNIERVLARGGELVRETADAWIVRRWTSAERRRYLCGLDERHYFVAQVRGGSTVRDAHRELKPDVVRDAERSHAGRTLRQGEWFFVPLTPAEKFQLAGLLRESPWALRRRESLGGNGRPHIADEVVMDVHRVYARGVVRHPDHKPLALPEWRRVHRNAEIRQNRGIYWID